MRPLIKILSFALLFSFAGSAFLADDAEARRGRKPRYRRAANSAACEAFSFKPKAKSIPGGRAANTRVPFMQPKIHAYLTRLAAQCKSLTVQSTFRDCAKNRKVGGRQKSPHLCGRGADVSGCGSNANPRSNISEKVCEASGLKYYNEGRRRYPHCEVPGLCHASQKD